MSAFIYSVDDIDGSKASAKRLSDAAASVAASPGLGGVARPADEQELIKDTAVGIGSLIVGALAALTQDRELEEPHTDADGKPLPARAGSIDVRVWGEVAEGEHVRVNVALSGGLVVRPGE